MKVAYIFPGQASQFVGMGKDLYDDYKDIFDFCNQQLGYDITDIMFNGPADMLTITQHTQPALMIHSYIVLQMIEKHGISTQDVVSYVAGHSLGEYSALTASKSLSLEEALAILQVRGSAMHNAVTPGVGGMVAILGANANEVDTMIAESKIASNEICQVANDNNASQVVVSGHNIALDKLIDTATNIYKKRAVKLAVSAPFHSPLMAPATVALEQCLPEVNMRNSIIPLVNNVTALPVTEAQEIKSLLIKQVEQRVRWYECVQYMIAQGVTLFVEIGSGSVLSNLIRRIDKNMKVISVSSPEHVESFAKML